MSEFATRSRISQVAAQNFDPVPQALDSWSAWSDKADASVRIVLLESQNAQARPVQVATVGTSRFARKGGVR